MWLELVFHIMNGLMHARDVALEMFQDPIARLSPFALAKLAAWHIARAAEF